MLDVVEGQDMFLYPNVESFAHGCNLSGVMGAGIARTFRTKYPQMFKRYQAIVSKLELGDVYVYRHEDGRYVFNIMSQPRPGPYANPEAVVEGLRFVRGFVEAKEGAIRSVALPAIGTGLGGLETTSTIKKITRVLRGSDVNFLLFVNYPGRTA